MNCPALPRDPAIPALSHGVDPAHMAQVFERAWASHGVAVRECAVVQAKYRPGRNASFVYRVSGQQHGTAIDWLCAGRMSNGADAMGRCARHRARTPDTGALPPFADADLGFFGWSLPHDPKLHALPMLLDPGFHQRALALAERPQSGPLRYVAESRACLRIDASGRPLAYAKLDRDPALAGHAHRTLNRIAARLGTDAELRLPRSIAVDTGAGIHWLSALPGAPMDSAQVLYDIPLAQRLGAQLAQLHRTDALPATHSPAPAALLTARSRELIRAWPGLAPCIDNTVSALHAQAPVLTPNACLHGDLHPHNVLIHAGEPGLIDLDAAHRGPALLELGHWSAHVFARALATGTPTPVAAEAMAAFSDAYQHATGHRIDPADLRWATAHALVADRAHRVLTRLHPTGEPRVASLLALAEALLAPTAAREVRQCA